MYDYRPDLVCILFYDHIPTFFYIFKKCLLLVNYRNELKGVRNDHYYE